MAVTKYPLKGPLRDEFGRTFRAEVDDNKNVGLYSTNEYGEYSYTYIPKEMFLKLAAQVYCHGVTETKYEKDVLAAHLAGYDVVDSSGVRWKNIDPYFNSSFDLFSDSFTIIRPKDKPQTLEEALKRIEALEKELAGVSDAD